MQPDCFESVQPQGKDFEDLTDHDSPSCLGSCCLACEAPDCKSPRPQLDEEIGETGEIQAVSTQPQGEGATASDLDQIHSRSWAAVKEPFSKRL